MGEGVRNRTFCWPGIAKKIFFLPPLFFGKVGKKKGDKDPRGRRRERRRRRRRRRAAHDDGGGEGQEGNCQKERLIFRGGGFTGV